MHSPLSRLICSVGLTLLAGHAVAQDTAKVPGVDESKIPDWVKRQAESPQKFIINSTAARPKVEPVKPEAAPVRPPVRQPARRQAPAALDAVVDDSGQRSNAQVDPTAAAASAATSAASSPASAPASSVASERTELPPAAEAMPAPAVAEAPSPAPPALVQPPPVQVAAPAPVQPVPAAVQSAPGPAEALVLMTKVDPVLTPDLIDGRLAEASVTVAFTVGPQGEVINPQITASSDRRLNRSVLRAVAEWRYAPVSEPRAHSVKFTFAVTQ